jgi:hypothetical protein
MIEPATSRSDHHMLRSYALGVACPDAPSWVHRRTAPAPGRRATRRTSSAQIARSRAGWSSAERQLGARRVVPGEPDEASALYPLDDAMNAVGLLICCVFRRPRKRGDDIPTAQLELSRHPTLA